MIWTGDHLDAMRRMQAALTDPARATTDEHMLSPLAGLRLVVGRTAKDRTFSRCIEAPLRRILSWTDTDNGSCTMARDVMTDTARTRARAVWSSGDYADVADRLVRDLGAVLVGATDVRPGSRVLDVAAGPGNVAIAAAMGAGAEVVALDVAPELLQAGRRIAEQRGVTLEWVEGDAADLPFPDASFDTVLSCVGVMFAADHERAASEILRVCRPGGTIGLLSWTPEGFVGELFRTIGAFAPPPPGAQSPTLWGRESHLLELFGDEVADVRSRTGIIRNDSFAQPVDFREYMKANYGPTIAAYRRVKESGRVAELDAAFAELCERGFKPIGDGRWRNENEYLITRAIRV